MLLQAPGVSQDSAASGLLHVRNDHANVQFRINGVMLPDGVTGFGSIFDTNWIGSIALVTGALPAEFGLRTVGLVDITTRADIFNNSGTIGVYGGSQGTIQPDHRIWRHVRQQLPERPRRLPASGAVAPATIASPASNIFSPAAICKPRRASKIRRQRTIAIHDFSQQEKGFAYMSTFIDPYTRLSLIAGTATNAFQIPNMPGQPVGLNGNPPVTSAFGITTFNSAQLNENQIEDTQYAVLALQRSVNGFDGQLSYFTRYNKLHFTPDPIGDLLFNGIASNISAPILYQRHPGRRLVSDQSGAYDPRRLYRQRRTEFRRQYIAGRTCTLRRLHMDAPEAITDNVSKLGWLAGVYIQDEWKITDSSRSMAVCASIRCGNTSMLTSSARG